MKFGFTVLEKKITGPQKQTSWKREGELIKNIKMKT
jgi:hypothetical protein